MERLQAALLGVLVAFQLVAAEPPAAPQRQPVPDEKIQKDAEVLVRDFFKQDFSKTDPQDRGVLAKRLLHEALQTNTDMDLKFVLLREARMAALDGGYVALALNALDATGAAFEFDAGKEKVDLLSKLARSARTPEAAQNVTEACLDIAEESLEKSQYEEARPLVGQAELAAKLVKDDGWQKETLRRIKNAQGLLREYDRVSASFKRLAEKPEDAEACTAVGRFLCCVKGDWANGLGLLVKGSDPLLKKVAQAELAGPADAVAQAKLGDEWWQYGKSLTGKSRFVIQEHAVTWLQKALPGLPEAQRELVTKTVIAFYTAALEQGQTSAAFQPGNVALAKNGTTLSRFKEGVAPAPETNLSMLDGNTTEYTGSTGFTSGAFPCGWIVNLPQLYLLQEIRVLLYDNDERIFRYVLETSADGKAYELVADCSKGGWRSWQTLKFPPRLVKFIRFKGLYDSANGGFYIVELEAYCLPPATPAKPRYPNLPDGDAPAVKKDHPPKN
jgi:hypothetical protein